MRKTSTALLALALAGASVTGLASSATADPAPTGLSAIGLVGDDKLVRIDLAEGGKTRGGPRVTGLTGDDTGLVGIDFRPQDGKLYGVGTGGGIYTLASDGVATKVSQLTVALTGESFGVDFNPAADRLRIISDTGQNLRHNVNAGGITIVDGSLVYGPSTTTAGNGTTGGTNTGGTAAVDVTGAAYTNNDADGAPPAGTGTVLYDLDTARDQLVIQSPPNAGALVAVGSLGVDTTDVVGFDIYSPLGTDGKAVSGADQAFAVLEVGGAAGLYAVSLTTGAATALGALDKAVTDLAVVYNQ
ncbi:MAG: DUF4394 domain-containing protein [Mycobacteriales bacterium]|nr:DUF4394 domain-containing protein [Mycobacteriales bacterium]